MRDAVLPLPYQQGGTTGQFPPSDILSPLKPCRKWPGNASLPSGVTLTENSYAFILPLATFMQLRSGRRESNPQQQLGRLRQYHFATPAYATPLRFVAHYQRMRHFAALRGSLPAYAPLRCASWLTTSVYATSLRFVAGCQQSGRPDLNRRPLRPKRSALPSAPRPGSTISIPLFPRPVKVKVHRL